MRRNYGGGDEEEDTQQMTQFSAHDSDNAQDNTMWEVLYIMAESKNKYQVQWAGKDPDTRKPWKPEWIAKEDCTNELIREWKQKKAKKAEARKRAQAAQRAQSVASSKISAPPESSKGSRQTSLDTSATTSAQYNPRGLKPFIQINRKRQRTPPSKHTATIAISSNSPSDVESTEQSRAQKRRRLAVSPKMEDVTDDSEVDQSAGSPVKPITRPIRSGAGAPSPQAKNIDPSPQDLSNTTIIPDSQQQFESSQHTGGSSFHESPERVNSRTLKPVPQISPSTFRDKLPPPLSPVEQFDSPPSQRLQKGQFSKDRLKYGPSTEKRRLESQNSYVTSPHVSQSVKQHSPELQVYRGKSHSSPPQDVDILAADEFPEPSRLDVDQVSPAKITPSSDDHTAGQHINLSHQSPRGTVPDVLSLQPLRYSVLHREQTDSPTSSAGERFNRDLKLRAMDATIRSLETRLTMTKEDIERRQKRLEEEVEAHARTKSTLEAQITSLTAALKQFASLSPDGIEGILHPNPSIVTTTEPLPGGPAIPPPYMRSAEDEALITQLREEAAKLQDQNAKLHADKTASDAMMEQVRDVARRAEAAKSDLARQVRKLEMVATNAPKNAEALYRSQITAAEEKIEGYEAQVALMIAQNNLTGDNIRKKAAKYDVLGRKYQNLTEAHEKTFEELCHAEDARDTAILLLHRIRDTLSEVNQSSPDDATLAKLKPLVGGLDEAMSGLQKMQEEDEEEDDDEEEDGDELALDHSSVLAMSDILPTMEDDDVPRAEEGGPAIVVEEVMDINQQFFGTQSDIPMQSQRSDENVFVCLWHPTEGSCPEYHSTRDALTTHIYHDHHDSL